jgi:hypothetical protein
MNLKEIIEATLIELDRGTEADTVAMYAKKFTVYANEAVDEIARRFKLYDVEGVITSADPSGYPAFFASNLGRTPTRITRIMPAAFGEPETPGDEPPIVATEETLKRAFPFVQQIPSKGDVSIMDKTHLSPGDPVFVEYRYVPVPMTADNPTDETPDIPEMFHALIPLYVRAREQCGQDPSTQGTSSAYFSLFNQKVYQLQRETLATPDSFMLRNYHFE